MLPYKNRLIKREDFEGVHRQGKFFNFENIAIKVRKNGIRESRIGFSVGINYSKKAVERNRIKRQFREFFRRHLEDIEGGMDIVVMARKNEGKTASSAGAEEAIRRALEKGKLIHEK